MKIPEEQKVLYIQALDVVDESYVDKLFDDLTIFTEKIEIKKLDDIQNKNFTEIAGMRKKEAEEKQEELNGFSFLLHNL